MDLPVVLTADLAELCSSVGAEPAAVIDPLRALSRDLRLAIRSYLGLELTVVDHGRAVTLTSFEPGARVVDIGTSMHLPLVSTDPVADVADPGADGLAIQRSALTLYASRPGALVDLAADLAYALAPGSPDRLGPAARSRLGAGEIRLDRHLTPQSTTSGLTGLDDVSTINRATGLLMGRGQMPTEARAALAQQAAGAGVSVAAWSARLLRPAQPSP